MDLLLVDEVDEADDLIVSLGERLFWLVFFMSDSFMLLERRHLVLLFLLSEDVLEGEVSAEECVSLLLRRVPFILVERGILVLLFLGVVGVLVEAEALASVSFMLMDRRRFALLFFGLALDLVED
jgi:hypothetical protein